MLLILFVAFWGGGSISCVEVFGLASASSHGLIHFIAAEPSRYNGGDGHMVTDSATRRAFVKTTTTATAVALLSHAVASPTLVRADTGAEVRGTPVNAFNGLAFQYRGSDFGGLKATDLSEPSVPYAEFVAKLNAGEVAFVEFLAPDGDAAYATFQDNGTGRTSTPIRIGEGYPIEQHDGYSSPAFAIRTVKNAGVPYKFTVPALSKTSAS